MCVCECREKHREREREIREIVCVFQQWPLPESLQTHQIAFSLCSASKVVTILKCVTDAKRACTLCFPARGSTQIANWLTVLSASLAWLCFSFCNFLSTTLKIFLKNNPVCCFFLITIYAQLCVIENTEILCTVLYSNCARCKPPLPESRSASVGTSTSPYTSL